MKKQLEKNQFFGLGLPKNVPAMKESGNDFKKGDQVMIEFGQAGELGPGTIAGHIEYDLPDFTFYGYVVELPYDEEDTIMMGYFHASRLREVKDQE